MSNLILLNGSGGTSNSSSIFAQTTGSTPIIGTPGGSLIGPGVGSLTFAANTLNVGDSFEYNASGDIGSLNNEGFTLRVYLGAIQLVATTITLPSLVISANHWIVNVKFTIQTTGASSKVGTSIQFSTVKANTLHYMHNVDSVASVDTTISNTFDLTGNFTTNNPTNEVYSQIGVLTKTY